jgi:RNA polymerase sigma-70 factor (ECF subfamily)
VDAVDAGPGHELNCMTSVGDENAAADAAAPETIETLFAALESPLLSYGMRLIGERGSAEDVVQEAFMKLHAQFGEVREPRRWLYRTVHNLALNHLRAGKKVVPMTTPEEGECEQSPDPEPLPDEQIVRWEGIGLVRLSLSALDARSRELVHLKFDEDLSYKQIAERTGLTVGNVGYILHHALKTISAELARTGLLP